MLLFVFKRKYDAKEAGKKSVTKVQIKGNGLL